jgi:competence protein ComEC
MLSGLMFAVVYWVWRRIPKFLMRLPAKKAAAIGGMVTAMVYAAMAGFSIPTQRTLYMLMTVTVMLLWNRPIAISRMLVIALFVVVLLDPWAVNAAGFWLSFGAVAVIAYATGARIGQLHWLTSAVKAQWAVTLGLLPCLVAMFGQFSLISPIANAFAIPVISFAVVPLAILGSLLPIDIALSLSHGVLSITMLVLDWLAALPFATWQQSAPSVGVTCSPLAIPI